MFFTFTYSQVAVNPTRPSASDNAFTTAQGYTELEFGCSGNKDSWNLPLLLKLGLLKDLEVGYTMNGLLNSNGKTDLGDPGAQIKYRFFVGKKLSAAIASRVEFQSINPKYTFYAAPSVITGSFQVDATFGIAIADDGLGYNSSFIHAVSFSPNLSSRFGLFVEIFGEMTTDFNPIYLDGGISYLFDEAFVADASLTYGLNDEASKDIVVQIGFTSLLVKLF